MTVGRSKLTTNIDIVDSQNCRQDLQTILLLKLMLSAMYMYVCINGHLLEPILQYFERTFFCSIFNNYSMNMRWI